MAPKAKRDLASVAGWKEMGQAAGLEQLRKKLERLRREAQDKERPTKKPKAKKRKVR